MSDHRHTETCWVPWHSAPICEGQNTYVQRLEAELADLRQERDWKIAYDALRQSYETQLADWQRHGVRVTVDCERCGGDGMGYTHLAYYDGPSEPCPDCGGTGKKLRDGAARYEVRGDPDIWIVSFPAEWLEEA